MTLGFFGGMFGESPNFVLLVFTKYFEESIDSLEVNFFCMKGKVLSLNGILNVGGVRW